MLILETVVGLDDNGMKGISCCDLFQADRTLNRIAYGHCSDFQRGRLRTSETNGTNVFTNCWDKVDFLTVAWIGNHRSILNESFYERKQDLESKGEIRFSLTT